MRLLACTLISAAVLLAGADVVQGQTVMPPAGGGPKLVTPTDLQPGGAAPTDAELLDPPGPPNPRTIDPKDPEIIPFHTVATLELSDADGWSAVFDIQMDGHRQWRAFGTVTHPEGYTSEWYIDSDTVTDPNATDAPVLTDVIVADGMAYMYGFAGPEPLTSIVLIAPWSGYSPRTGGRDLADWFAWVPYMPQATSEVVTEAADKALSTSKGTFRDLMQECIDLAVQTCAPRCVQAVRFSIGPDGVHCEFDCCEDR